MRGTVTAKEGQILYTSIPYDKGWTVKVDGKEAKIIPLFDGALIGLDLDEGEHTLEFTYEAEGLRLGAVISAVGILICLVLVIYERKKRAGYKNKKRKQEY